MTEKDVRIDNIQNKKMGNDKKKSGNPKFPFIYNLIGSASRVAVTGRT